jgi:acetylornithine deacetylase/succinyl-diaminopimelate desuccinylase-like protein
MTRTAVLASAAVLVGHVFAAGQVPPAGQGAPPPAAQQLARDIFKELIEINTTESSGDVTMAAEAMAARLRAGGFPAADVQVLGPVPRKGNLVARLRGTGKGRPILLLAHLDVVEARREDWSFDPFTFLERDGYFYGRGTADIKSGAAVLVADLIRLRQEGFRPDRDLIVALTADEEGGNANGPDWLLRAHRELVDAEYCLNTDGGNGEIRKGRRIANELQTSEKVYLSFRLETKNPGGHSSLPVKDNAIYGLADGLARLARFDFPVKLNETTRGFFEKMAATEHGDLARDMKAVAGTPMDRAAASRLSAASPYFNAMLRTTCVATGLEAGHAENALPQTARAVVNCRILPGESPQDVRQTLVKVLADDKISVTPIAAPFLSPMSPLRPDVVSAVERVTADMWPGVPAVPMMSTGASDGIHFRAAGIPVFGVSGLFDDVDDVRAHGRDERLGVQAFYEGVEFMYRLVKVLASPVGTRSPLPGSER